MITRKQIMQALLAQLSTAQGFNSYRRKYVEYSNVPQAEKPAMLIVKGDEKYAEKAIAGQSPKRTISVNVLIYTSVTDQSQGIVPEDVLDDLMDAVDIALMPPPGPAGPRTQTLGGLVHNCCIDGTVKWVNGDVDGNGMAVIPLTIMLP